MGQITRLLGPSRGSFLTFAAAGRQAAPGQLSAAEMNGTYRFRRIQPSTKLLGILGMPVAHSLSPTFHNKAFETADLDFAYVKLPAPDLQDFMAHAKAVGLSGFSVTIPHKVAVMEHLSHITPEARATGAVNTVSEGSEGWAGDNTDVAGVAAALRSVNFDPKGKTVVILGRGGAAKAAVAAMRGARQVLMVGRDEVAAAGRFACDLLVNATPIGMHPDADAIPCEGPLAANVVFDLVYNPAVTRLLVSAAAQGKTTISGDAMFAAQAARQFEIWTGRPAPPGIYETQKAEA
jgi:3-dehydroquinate dehydratase/shikimate dehydrogenase